MSRRALLSSEQRARLFGIPVDQAEMARHYVLSPEDLALVRAKRRAANRLGFAIQLCALRYPGRAFEPLEAPPAPTLSFIASQIGVDPALFSDYARRGETRREHLIELQKLLTLRSFGLADWRACLRMGADAAWATDRGEPIIQAMLDHLRGANVLLPAVAVLERIGLAARARARKKAFEALANGLTDAARDALERLLRVDPEVRCSRFAWLRDYSESPAPSNIIALLDRLEYVRDLGIGAERSARIHATRLARLVEEGAVMTVQHIADLEPARRTAILVAQVSSLETRLADATLAIFEKYMGSLFTKARSRDERRFQATKRDVAKALILFRRTIAALKQAKATGEDGVAAVDREVGMKRLDEALPIIGSVADVADQDNYVAARAAIINAHHKHPMAAIWDDGTTSSSNGQYFRAGGRTGPGGAVNAKYGIDPGVVVYTHVSGRYDPFHTRVLSATMSEARYVLNGLHHHAHQTDLRIAEHYTDTAGATDHVFGLCHLLSYRFAPRIKDLKDRKLYTIDKPGAYRALLGSEC